MKNLYQKGLFLFVLAALPVSSFAFSYQRNPIGSRVGDSIVVSVSSVDILGDFNLDPGSLFYSFSARSENNSVQYSSTCFPVTSTNPSATISGLSNDTNWVAVYIDGYSDNCISGTNSYILEGNEIDTIFSYFPGGATRGFLFGGSLSRTAATTTNDLLAAVGAVSSDVFDSAFAWTLLSIGVFVGLFIVRSLIEVLYPGEEKKFIKVRTKKYKNQPNPSILPEKIEVVDE